MDNPKVILLISGKRKSGKDFISESLLRMFGNDECAIIRISEPIKSHYAKEKGLNLIELMSDNGYKERYRLEMIQWSEEVRNNDYGYFCKTACEKAPKKSVWIVSDIRRKTDIKWFKSAYGEKIITIRISASTEVRENRGFKFTKGVDDVASECDLDDYKDWNLSVDNNNNDEFNVAIQKIREFIEK